MLEVAVAKYGEALEISAHDDNDIIIELTGLPATATLSYQDSTTGIPAGESSLAILGSTAPEDIETVRTAYLALELPEESTYVGDFTLVISDSVTCTEANVSDCDAAKILLSPSKLARKASTCINIRRRLRSVRQFASVPPSSYISYYESGLSRRGI